MLEQLQRGWRQPGWLNYAFLPLTFLYRLLHGLRYGCYKLGLCKRVRLQVPVIVVGGISVGGAGKTPLVIALARHYREAGMKPGIICRGYGGASRSWPMAVDHATDAGLVGDEAQLMFELSGVPVVAGPDRVRDGLMLVDKFDCDLVISDDGFQHYRLQRDADVVVIDGEAGLGNGWCLPAGPLREPPSAVTRADAIVFNILESSLPVPVLEERHPPVFSVSVELGVPYNLHSGEKRALEEFSGNHAHAVAGLGNPARFFTQLESAGVIVNKRAFADHHPFVESDFTGMEDAPILMTEKDGIKCRDMKAAQNMWAVPATVKPEPGLLKILNSKLEGAAHGGA